MPSSDVIVIGGGFSGVLLTYYLSVTGIRVVLLEAGSLGCGSSGACAGRVQLIESETEEYLDLALSGFSRLAATREELEIDLEWELPGHITLLSTIEQWNAYQERVNCLQRKGIVAEMLDCGTLQKYEPALSVSGLLGAVYSQEAHLNPFNFLMGYANAARRSGATILTQTPVTGFQVENGTILTILSKREKFVADTVVLACGAWTGILAEWAGGELPMRFTHAEALVTEPIPRIIHHHVGMAGFYETVHGNKPTVTLGVGQHPNGTLVVSNAIQQSSEIDQASTAWGMPALSNALKKYFPALSQVRVMRTWAAPSPFLPDYLPAVGWLPGFENLFVLAGLHLAIPTVPILAEWSAKMVLERQEIPALSSFSPGRFTSGGNHDKDL
ncbi:MAG: FAD-dependent oxidoreductase [Anaerolineales bacterium]